MTSVPRSRYVLFWGTALLGCLVDLLTKHLVFKWLGSGGGNIHWVIPDYVGFQTNLNFGALFGIGQGKVWFFSLLSICAILGIVYWIHWGGAVADRWLTSALGCVWGGILGNLYDRLGLWDMPDGGPGVRAVRDWILFRYGEWTWPNFNVADSLLVCGAGLLMWHSLFPPKGTSVPTPAQGK